LAIFDTSILLLDILPVWRQAHFSYIPTFPGNALFAAIFGPLFSLHLIFGLRFHTWGFLIDMLGGLAIEFAGYIGRIYIHENPFAKNPFPAYVLTRRYCFTINGR